MNIRMVPREIAPSPAQDMYTDYEGEDEEELGEQYGDNSFLLGENLHRRHKYVLSPAAFSSECAGTHRWEVAGSDVCAAVQPASTRSELRPPSSLGLHRPDLIISHTQASWRVSATAAASSRVEGGQGDGSEHRVLLPLLARVWEQRRHKSTTC